MKCDLVDQSQLRAWPQTVTLPLPSPRTFRKHRHPRLSGYNADFCLLLYSCIPSAQHLTGPPHS